MITKSTISKNVPSSVDCAVNHSVPPVLEKEQIKKLGCATNSSDLQEIVNPALSFLKMSQVLLDTKTDSRSWSHKWKKSVISDTHCLFRLQRLRHRTKGKGSSLSSQETNFWNTPLASDGSLAYFHLHSALKKQYGDIITDGIYRNPELVAWLMGVPAKLKSIILESLETASNTKQDSSSPPSSKQSMIISMTAWKVNS